MVVTAAFFVLKLRMTFVPAPEEGFGCAINVRFVGLMRLLEAFARRTAVTLCNAGRDCG